MASLNKNKTRGLPVVQQAIELLLRLLLLLEFIRRRDVSCASDSGAVSSASDFALSGLEIDTPAWSSGILGY